MRTFPKLQALVYDILPWKKVPKAILGDWTFPSLLVTPKINLLFLVTLHLHVARYVTTVVLQGQASNALVQPRDVSSLVTSQTQRPNCRDDGRRDVGNFKLGFSKTVNWYGAKLQSVYSNPVDRTRGACTVRLLFPVFFRKVTFAIILKPLFHC